MLDDFENVNYDGINTIKTFCKDGIILPKAGDTETYLANKLRLFKKLILILLVFF